MDNVPTYCTCTVLVYADISQVICLLLKYRIRLRPPGPIAFFFIFSLQFKSQIFRFPPLLFLLWIDRPAIPKCLYLLDPYSYSFRQLTSTCILFYVKPIKYFFALKIKKKVLARLSFALFYSRIVTRKREIIKCFNMIQISKLSSKCV